MQGTAPKILVVVLVALALLFVGTLFLGNGQNSGGDSDLGPGWITGIQQSFARSQPFDFKEISTAGPATCLRPDGQALVIAVNQTCVYTLAKSSTNVRRIVLKPGTAAVAQLFLAQKIQGKDAVEARQTLPLAKGGDDNPDHLDLYQDGGTLKIKCEAAPGASQCLLLPDKN